MNRFIENAYLLCERRIRFFAHHNLNQRNNIRRHEVMGPHHTSCCRKALGNLTNGEAGAIAADGNGFRDFFVQHSKNGFFQH